MITWLWHRDKTAIVTSLSGWVRKLSHENLSKWALMKEIASGIHVSLEYDGPNVGFVIVPGGAIAIDVPMLPSDATRWRKEIMDLAGGEVLYTVLTDTHPSRLLCAGIVGAPIVTGREAYDQASAYTDGFWRSVVDGCARRYPQAADDLAEVRVRLPEILFVGTLSLHAGDMTIDVQSVDGAAPGSARVYFPEQDILFAGDTVVAGTHPYMAATPSSEAWMRTLRLLRRKQHENTIVVPGRGALCDQSATLALSDYIALARRRVRSLHTAGRARADVLALVPEMLEQFPVADDGREYVQRRVKSGLVLS